MRLRTPAGWLTMGVIGLTGCSTTGPTMADCVRGYHHPGGDTSRCTRDDVRRVVGPSTTARPGTLPAAVRLACGHPGRRVVLQAASLEVPRAECDLTGVTLVYDKIGVTVPSERGGGALAHADGPAGSSTTEVRVNKATGDVTFTVTHS